MLGLYAFLGLESQAGRRKTKFFLRTRVRSTTDSFKVSYVFCELDTHVACVRGVCKIGVKTYTFLSVNRRADSLAIGRRGGGI